MKGNAERQASLILIVIGIWVLGIAAWIVNLFKLIGSAGAENWGATVIHAIGLLGPVAVVTVWF